MSQCLSKQLRLTPFKFRFDYGRVLQQCFSLQHQQSKTSIYWDLAEGTS